ncbi:glycoside hydrolase family 76 protein [Hypoxylon sp. FL1284]|nr:glycoside hydrolase family 76 protein [Hypoxylon sp. FL1284]
MTRIISSSLACALLAARGALAAGLTVDVDDVDSIKAAASQVAEDLMDYYDGSKPGHTPGILPLATGDDKDGKYNWWTGAFLWGGMLDYRSRTGDNKYDGIMSQGLLWQIGEHNDYMPTNYSVQIGNDDQAFWALSALLAEESSFTDPPARDPAWRQLAKNVFDEQTVDGRRVDDGDCKGALRWQIFPYNDGYEYVNTASNVAYFNLAAQLASLTDNKTYSDAAHKTFDLLTDLGFVSDKFDVYDGAHVDECSEVNKVQFSNTAAMLLQGSAFMFNYTNGASDWKDRVDGIVTATLETFFPKAIAYEPACEKLGNCDSDMTFYKGILHRALGWTAQLAPHTADMILANLKASAKAAVAQCTGGTTGRQCGYHWDGGRYDKTSGAGQQLSVLSALVSILPAQAAAPADGSGSANGTASEGQTSDQDTHDSLGAKAGASMGALVGAMLLSGFLLA